MLRALLFCILLSTPLLGQDKPTPVYDQTGILSFHAFGDVAIHFDTNDGHSYDAYCNTTSTSIDCHEGVGGGYIITMQNGTVLIVDTSGIPKVDPLLFPNGYQQPRGEVPKEVVFRLADVKLFPSIKRGRNAKVTTKGICVPYTDKHGNPKETCYVASEVKR